MKILILGLPKTGTTALYAKIKNSISGEVECMFEPRNYEKTDSKDVLAKVLFSTVETNYDSFLEFDKKIILVRDLRDWIISSALYGFSYGKKCFRDSEASLEILKLLRQKEKDPDSVSMVKLFNSIRFGPNSNFEINVNNRMLLLNRFIDFHDSNRDFFLLRYEDFIDGNLGDLEDYLGFKLVGSSDVGANLRRVVRTKGYGNWKNWFTDEDVNKFRPIFEVFMNRYGYLDDWKTNLVKKIDPEHCTVYALRNLNERRYNAGMSLIKFENRTEIELRFKDRVKKFIKKIF